MKKIVIAVIGIGLLVYIKMAYFPKENNENLKSNAKEIPTIPTNFFVVKTFYLADQVFTTGVIGAFNQVEIQSEIAGKVMQLYFKEGEFVKKGTPLIKIKDTELQALLLKLKTQLKIAQDKLHRLEKLLSIEGVSKEEYEVQEGEVKNIEADIAYQEALVEKTLIVAPFDGKIGLKNISEGAYITPATVITLFVQIDPIFIEFSVPEKYISLIKNGKEISFSISDGQKEKTYRASIFAVDPKIDEETRSLKARAIYKGKETFLMGTFVKVLVDVNQNERAIMIPTQSLIPVMKGNKVFVIRNNIAEEVSVQTGIRTEQKIEITGGLEVGDTILTNGLLTVKKNSKIKFLNEEF